MQQKKFQPTHADRGEVGMRRTEIWKRHSYPRPEPRGRETASDKNTEHLEQRKEQGLSRYKPGEVSKGFILVMQCSS